MCRGTRTQGFAALGPRLFLFAGAGRIALRGGSFTAQNPQFLLSIFCFLFPAFRPRFAPWTTVC